MPSYASTGSQKIGDGTDEALVSATGRLLVETQGGASGGTSAVDDAAFTIATDSGTPMMGVATSDAVDAGDVGVVGMTATRAMFTTLKDSTGDSVMDDVNDAVRVNVVTGVSGTQYTEDVAAAADPVGNVPILIRKDTPASIVSADGDNIAQRGTDYGAAYVQVVTSSGSFVDTFGGGTQYTEDAAAAADPVGTAVILVRKDTPATQVSADGDNVAQRGTNYGAAYVQVVTSTGAYVDSFGGTAYTEDVASAADPVGTQLIARRRDSLSTETTTDGDNTAVNCTGKGELYVKHTDAITANPERVSTSTLSNVSASASSVSLLASTSGRKGAMFFNDSTSPAYLKLGATASTTSFTVKMFAYSYYELPMPVYTGAIDAIWDSATGSMRITELT